MRTGHIFAGAGGGLLADLILGHEPILAVEWDEHACAVLRERCAEGWFPGLHVHESDVRNFDFRPWARRLDCLAAGFPCQDISSAGNGAGIEGARSGLVSEVFRGIDECAPPIVWLENSPHIRTKGRDYVIGQLVARGYSWKDGVIGAADVGAGHQRDRWFCLAANADGMRKLQSERCFEKLRGWLGNGHPETANAVRNRSQRIGWQGINATREEEPAACPETPAADVMRQRLQVAVQRGGLSETDAATIQAAAGYVSAHHWSPPDIGICRVVDGLANRMDRIKCAGNGQVPLQAAAAFMILSSHA